MLRNRVLEFLQTIHIVSDFFVGMYLQVNVRNQQWAPKDEVTFIRTFFSSAMADRICALSPSSCTSTSTRCSSTCSSCPLVPMAGLAFAEGLNCPVPGVMKAHCSYSPIFPTFFGYLAKRWLRMVDVDLTGEKNTSLNRGITEIMRPVLIRKQAQRRQQVEGERQDERTRGELYIDGVPRGCTHRI